MLPTAHRKILSRILAALDGAGITWALTGSASFALQGVPVQPNDVDIQTDEVGAYAIERILAHVPNATITKPVEYRESSSIRSHFGNLDIDGVKVEIMGALQKRLPNGEWEPAVDVRTLRIFVAHGSAQVPVLPLQYEVQAYLKLGRKDRAELLERFLRESPGSPRL